MSYLLITKPNLIIRGLNSSRNPFRVYSLFRNACGKMTQKISQNKTYVAVNVPAETQTNNASGRFFRLFRRNTSTARKIDGGGGEKKSEYLRLFSLAKPEKWNLLGKFFVWCIFFIPLLFVCFF